MNKNDFDRFSEIIVGVAELVSAELSEAGLALMFRALEPYTIEQIDAAATEIIRGRKYTKMPTPAEFISKIDGDVQDVATVQAMIVLDAVKSVGAWASVVFEDPVTMAVVRQNFGGWIKLCDEMMAKNENWFIKDFCRVYESFRNQRVREFGRLSGRLELENSANGIEIDNPVAYIGDREKCKQIESSGGQALPRIPVQLVAGIG